ncbi:MAG: DUF2341 domain-containing protein [Candidatus Caenarcaniphilales bacterium]|nr:DUF2341 domain-containing protein [Candidatus Caenarcaniphilales bacterium]
MRKLVLLSILIFIIINKVNAAWYNQGWNNRIKITIQKSQVNGSVSDFPVYINLDDLPDSFFDNCNNNGSDLRVTLGDGSSELAREIVFVDKTANLGELWFKAPSLTSSTNGEFYIYYGNSSASEPGAATTHGSQNVWSNGFVAVYHMNAVTNGTASVLDSTSYARHGTPRGGMATLLNSQLGKGIDYDGVNDYISIAALNMTTNNISFTAWVNGIKTNSYTGILMSRDAVQPVGMGYNTSPNNLTYTWNDNSFSTFTWNGPIIPNNTSSYIGISINPSKTSGYSCSSGSCNEVVNSIAHISQTLGTEFIIGGDTCCWGRLYDGLMDEIRIALKSRNSNWIQTEYNNQNSPNTFYVINPIESNFHVANPYKIKITINRSQVNGSVTEFPVYVNLDHMPSHFFNNIKSSGADIRITQSDLVTRVPVELVSLDKATSNGELWFRASALSSTTNSDFYLWYGNNGATMPTASSPYGSQNVWSNGFVAVYHMNQNPSGGAASILDSTRNQHHGTPANFTSNDLIEGPVGKAYDFSDANNQIDLNLHALMPVTLTTWSKFETTPNGGLFTAKNDPLRGVLILVNYLLPYLNPNNYQYASGAGTITLNSWDYYNFVFPSSNAADIRTYKNNIDISSSTPHTGTENSFNGLVFGSGYNYFDGFADEIRVASKTRSLDWITTEYNNQNSPNTFYTITPINNSNIFWGVSP